MRLAAMVVAAAMVMAIGGCMAAAEKERVEKEEKISAARLGGKFRHDDPIVKMLSDDERSALSRAGMMEPRQEGEELGEGEGEGGEETAAADEEKSDMDKAGDVMMSVLSVTVTLGMMAAPYLLF
jgi:hypothetical protein